MGKMTQKGKMTKRELDDYRQLLVHKRKMLSGTLNHLHNDVGSVEASRGANSGDTADMGSDTFEQDFALSLIENEGNVMQKIEDALERIDEGTFGSCLQCEKRIVKARLRAIPWTDYCIECQRKAEAS